MRTVINKIRDLLNSGRTFYGTFATLSDSAVSEIVSLAGFDFVIIDLEHTALSLETVQHHLQAAKAQSLGTMVRIGRNQDQLIMRCLEIGADGVIASRIRTAEDARLAVDAARYAPRGKRSLYDGQRAAQFSAHGFPSYREMTTTLNDETVVAMLVEDKEGVENIDQILAVAGIDLVIAGPSDLSYSLGRYGTVGDPEVASYVQRVATACREAGVGFAVPPGHGTLPISPQELEAQGVRFMFRGSDAIAMLEGLRQRLAAMKGSPVSL